MGTWRSLPAAPIPADYNVGVWTGAELFIHAIVTVDGEGTHGTADAAYDPVKNSWRRLPASPYPVRNVEGGTRVVWTGTEMLAFGMMDAAFAPATNRWRQLAAGAGGPAVTVWTGRQVLMWGGGCCGSSTANGVAYDINSDLWQPMPAAPLAARHAGGVWTGTELVIIGGQAWGPAGSTAFADGAAYNPATRTWRTLPPLPGPVVDATITWTGTEIFVVGGARPGEAGFTLSAKAMAYNPVSNAWRRLADMPMSRFNHMAVWTGSQLLVWGGQTTPVTDSLGSYTAPPYGVAYDPATDRWAPMPKSPLRGRTSAISVWTGTEMIIWGGMGVSLDTRFSDGAAFRPA